MLQQTSVSKGMVSMVALDVGSHLQSVEVVGSILCERRNRTKVAQDLERRRAHHVTSRGTASWLSLTTQLYTIKSWEGYHD